MGDFNFHREAENSSIPAGGWGEVPAVVELGETWDYARNLMLPHYLPLRNIYNGFGLGETFAWPSPMRLDRVLVYNRPSPPHFSSSSSSARFDCTTAKARLFADQPIHEQARGRTPLPLTGPELQEAHRAIPWQEFLYPSDHFGIFVELPGLS
jgi:hypothetical protein